MARLEKDQRRKIAFVAKLEETAFRKAKKQEEANEIHRDECNQWPVPSQCDG